MTVYFEAKDAANGHRPNWPDNDPRWLRATYDELIRLRAMLERTVVYTVTLSPEDQQTNRDAEQVRQSFRAVKEWGDIIAMTALGGVAGAAIAIAVLVIFGVIG